MGGAHVSDLDYQLAFELGALVAERGWILLNGGRDAGVMRASAEGAKSRGGMTIGILPTASKMDANPFIDVPILTNLGDARNVINVLSSDVVVACPGAAGTLSEVALALKNEKTVFLLRLDVGQAFDVYRRRGKLLPVKTAQECVEEIALLLNE
ncbi:TIGR00725 family protein [candidate division KSB1 bacterium]|nr:TIGR00725 family protein [candidate division KSB1 bacterium]RQW02146.1 MAG: TIGR00725 family protein [candidate division KSB1 bacterium]